MRLGPFTPPEFSALAASRFPHRRRGRTRRAARRGDAEAISRLRGKAAASLTRSRRWLRRTSFAPPPSSSTPTISRFTRPRWRFSRPPPRAASGRRRSAAPAGSKACSPGSRRRARHAPDLVLIHDGARIFPSRALIARAIEAAERHGAAIPAIAAQRHDQAGRRLGAHPRFAGPRLLARGADAAGVPLRSDPRSASARGARRRRRSDRRRRGRRLGRPCDLRFRRRPGELQSDDAAGFARGRGASDECCERRPRRPGFRRPRLRARRSRLARRRAHPARPGLERPFRRRRRACTRSPTRSTARSATATSAPISRPPIRAGAAPPPRSSLATPRRGCARAAASSPISTPTLICEAPKIGPLREAMRARIAEIAGVAIDRVGVKATTSEGLGFTGRREGIACLASATIRLPMG